MFATLQRHYSISSRFCRQSAVFGTLFLSAFYCSLYERFSAACTWNILLVSLFRRRSIEIAWNNSKSANRQSLNIHIFLVRFFLAFCFFSPHSNSRHQQFSSRFDCFRFLKWWNELRAMSEQQRSLCDCVTNTRNEAKHVFDFVRIRWIRWRGYRR